MESLSASCQTSGSLKRIYMMDTSYQNADNHKLVIPLPSEIFRPLLKFSELSCVKFIGIGNYNLDDNLINDITVSWPSIRELKFASKRRASCTVTFAAMMSLVSRCKSLQVLHLTVNATQPTMTPRSANGRKVLWPKQTALRKLRLGYSEVSKVARVPYFLTKVFPTLSDFKWYVDFGDSNIDIAMESALAEARRQLRVLRNLADDDMGDELEVDSDEDESEW
ncbi:hypothetical protein BDR04DRAFT_1141472 [Suillus decipiens]|nr:hypothetical protein BDR04DRAFT_1141472 [Suillus decipiens]